MRKRISIRVTPALHHRVRIGTATEQTTLQDLLVAFLEARYPEQPAARKPSRAKAHHHEEAMAK